MGNILGSDEELWVRPVALSVAEARARISYGELRAIASCFRSMNRRGSKSGLGVIAFAKFLRAAFPQMPNEICRRLFVACASPVTDTAAAAISFDDLVVALAVVLRGNERERATLLWGIYAQNDALLRRRSMNQLCILLSTAAGAKEDAASARAVLDALFRDGSPNAAEWERFVCDVGVGAACHPICGSWLEQLRVGLLAEGSPLAALGASILPPAAAPEPAATAASGVMEVADSSAAGSGAAQGQGGSLSPSALEESMAGSSSWGGGGGSSVPSIDAQRAEVERRWESGGLKESQQWSAVPMEWWQQWCRASGFQYAGSRSEAEIDVPDGLPGPLSVASLVRGSGTLGGGGGGGERGAKTSSSRGGGARGPSSASAAESRSVRSTAAPTRVWLLKEGLVVGHHFKLVAEPIWTLLSSWYPLDAVAEATKVVDSAGVGAEGRAHITRSVIATEDGLELDLFLLDVQVRRVMRRERGGARARETAPPFLRLVFSSKSATLSDILNAACRRWWLRPERCRLWMCPELESDAVADVTAPAAVKQSSSAPACIVRNVGYTLEMAEVLPGQQFELEVQRVDGTWARRAAPTSGQRPRAPSEESRPKRPRLLSANAELPVGLSNLGSE